jgi:hypothetical protein
MASNHNFDTRLSRLETLIDGIGEAINKIQIKLDSSNKINWAPIAIGVTIFFTVAGSISTIYNARFQTLNAAVEVLSTRTISLEKGDVEKGLKIQTVEERLTQLEKDVDDVQRGRKQDNRDRIDDLEHDR